MTKTCRVCQTRPIAGGIVRGTGDTDKGTARAVELCLPCLAEAGWENQHNDEAHDDPNGGGESTDGCWICYPELNEASADYARRLGTSRAGMRITVPIRATGAEKAKAVIAKLPADFKSTVRTRNGETVINIKRGDDKLILAWDAAGRFIYGPSSVNGKKGRNVSGALRALGL